MSLFNIRTEVTLTRFVSGGLELIVIAAKPTRKAIWDMVTESALNPGYVRWEGGYPTHILLSPNKGVTWDQAANLAYAFALVAEIGEKWTDLFVMDIFDMASGKVAAEGFVPDLEVVEAFVQIYLAWKSVASLRAMVSNLHGLDIHSITKWNTEAIEAYRRASEPVQAQIESKLDEVGGYARLARTFAATRSQAKQRLLTQIGELENLFSHFPTKAKAFRRYIIIREAIADEQRRLNEEFGHYHLAIEVIEDELMPAIRKATPPPPVTAK